MTIDPTRIYEIKKIGTTGTQVCKVLPATLNATVANNQLVITAVTGSIIRVLSYKFSAAAGASQIAIQSGAAGTPFYNIGLAANGQDVGIPWDAGYFESVVSEGIYVDVSTTAANINMFYIVYTP